MKTPFLRILTLAAMCFAGCDEAPVTQSTPQTSQQAIAASSFASSGAAASAPIASSATPGSYASPTRFDGSLLYTTLVQSIAEGPIVRWEECMDASGNAIDDCVIITEQDTGATMTTLVLSADVCRRGAICHGGYTVLAERSTTFESSAPYGSRGGIELAISGGFRMLHARTFNVGGRTLYGKRLVDVMAFDGFMEVTSGYQDVSIDVFDVNGAALDNVGWVMSASASGVDCGVVGDGAGDVVFALNESMAANAPIAEAVAAVSLIGTGGFVLADGTHAGVTAARAAGLSAAASVGAQFHAASAHTLAAAAGIAEQVTAELGTELCETYSAGTATTESDFDPGDHEPRDRETYPVEAVCDVGYYWVEHCYERSYTRTWTEVTYEDDGDGNEELVYLARSETVTYTDCEWSCLPT